MPDNFLYTCQKCGHLSTVLPKVCKNCGWKKFHVERKDLGEEYERKRSNN